MAAGALSYPLRCQEALARRLPADRLAALGWRQRETKEELDALADAVRSLDRWSGGAVPAPPSAPVAAGPVDPPAQTKAPLTHSHFTF